MEPADSGKVCSRGLRGRARGGASHPSVEAEVNDASLWLSYLSCKSQISDLSRTKAGTGALPAHELDAAVHNLKIQ